MEQANETHGGDSRPVRNIARGDQTSGDASARQVITNLSSSVWAFSALACALEAGLLEALSEARRLTDLAQRSGIPACLMSWSPWVCSCALVMAIAARQTCCHCSKHPRETLSSPTFARCTSRAAP